MQDPAAGLVQDPVRGPAGSMARPMARSPGRGSCTGPSSDLPDVRSGALGRAASIS